MNRLAMVLVQEKENKILAITMTFSASTLPVELLVFVMASILFSSS